MAIVALRNLAPHRWGFDGIFLAVFISVFLCVAWATIPHYGITWDCAEYYLGDKYLYFYLTLDPAFLDTRVNNVPLYTREDHPDFYAKSQGAIEKPEHVWPLGPTSLAASKHLLFTTLGLIRDPIDASHAVLPLYAAALLAGLFFFTRGVAGRWPAVIAVIATACYPRYWADIHNNPKDGPSTALFCLVLMVVATGLAKDRPRWLVAGAVLWGAALAAKANAFFLPVILGPWLAYRLVFAPRPGRAPISRRTIGALAAFPVIAAPVLLGLWPWVLVDFPEHLDRHIEFLKWRAGGGEPHWKAQSLINGLVTMPLPVMLLAALGIVFIARRSWVARRLDDFHLLVLLWLAVPVLRVSAPRALDFDVIRHWMEFVPALGILAGLGGGWLMDLLAGGVPAAVGAGAYEVPGRTGPKGRTGRTGRPGRTERAAPRVSTRRDEPPSGGRGPLERDEQVENQAVRRGASGGRLAAGGPAGPAGPFGRLRAWSVRPSAKLLLTAAWFSPVIAWSVRNHPNELVFYNALVGGLGGAQARGLPEATDYWGSSYRQGLRWINAHAEPGATLTVGVSARIVMYVQKIWLRKDITQVRTDNLGGAGAGAPIYLMYITRRQHYEPLVRITEREPAVHEIVVDGGTILRILKLKKDGPAFPRGARGGS